MSQAENHLIWCLKDPKRLIKGKPDKELALKHLKKSEYNYAVLQTMERAKIYDWALNIGFYAIYHCFLAITAKYGYASRNQSCTTSVLLMLIDQKKLSLEKDLILQFDTLDIEENETSSTVRMEREISTYGVETSINIDQLKRTKELVVKLQRETIRIVAE